MNISVIIPYLSKNGGTRAIISILKQVARKNNKKINIFFCVIPPDIYTKKYKNNYIFFFIKIIFYLFIHFFKKKKLLDEYNINSKNFKINFIYNFGLKKNFFLKKKFYQLNKSDILISTSFESTYIQDYIYENFNFKLKYFYFVQHIETWPIYNDDKNWIKAKKISNKRKIKIDYAIHKVKLNNNHAEFRKLVFKTYKKNYRSIITTSTYLKKCLTEIGSTNIKPLVPIGNDVNIFGKKISNLEKDRRFKHILLIFRSIPWKGDSDNLWILRELDKKYNNLKFIIIFSKKEFTIPKLRNKYEIHTNIDDNYLNKIYWKTDIAIFNNIIEGFGSMQLESMCCKTACVMTNVGAIKDFGKDNHSCFIVDPKKKFKILEKVEILLNDEKLVEKFKNNAYLSTRKISWSYTAEKFFDNLFDQ
jgi:glycosyltransferase involved in cell wall biosynthesis